MTLVHKPEGILVEAQPPTCQDASPIQGEISHLSPTNAWYVENISLVAMLAAKRLAGVAPEVNLREHVICIPPPSANKAAYFGFEIQSRCHQKSKAGVSVALQKVLYPPKKF